ncbi:hypothetical protein [Nonomuraea endophytica]|uniref:hypothetical protein n=1 Tax=Nonomuraea endophytica TaxID=714136 RepID=UPI0037CAF18E
MVNGKRPFQHLPWTTSGGPFDLAAGVSEGSVFGLGRINASVAEEPGDHILSWTVGRQISASMHEHN